MNSFNNAAQLARQRLVTPLKNHQETQQQALLESQRQNRSSAVQQASGITTTPRQSFFQQISGNNPNIQTARKRQLDQYARRTTQNPSLGQLTSDIVGDITGDRQKQLENQIGSYQSNVTVFNQKVKGFETDVAKLNETGQSNATKQALYSDLQKRNTELQTDYKALQAEELGIQQREKKMYSTGIYSLLGSNKIDSQRSQYSTQSMSTYWIYEGAKEKADWWEQNVVSNVENVTKGFGVVGSFATGLSRSPGIITEMIGMIPAGVERSTYVAGDLPGYAVAGLGLQAQSIYKGATERPAEFSGEMLGLALITKGVRGVIGKGYGYARTTGKTYIPIENIGFTPEAGYPLGKTTTPGLHESFTESKLVPTPYKMAGGKLTEVPYTFKTTRLPTDVAGTPQMWTAWENRLKPDVLLGTRATVGKSFSEISGIYGAPAALTYFTKAGGQSAKIFGFDLPKFKSPSLLRTTLKSVGAIPSRLSRQTTSMKAKGANTNLAYAGINKYLETSAEPGKAYFPNTKAEYEAVLPEGNVLELKGARYYTKVSGKRVPIYELEATGEIKGITGNNKLLGRSKSGSSGYEAFEPAPYVSGFNIFSSVILGSGKYSKYGYKPGKSLKSSYKELNYESRSYKDSSKLTSGIYSKSSSLRYPSRSLLSSSFLGSSLSRSGISYPGEYRGYYKSISQRAARGSYYPELSIDKRIFYGDADSSKNNIFFKKSKAKRRGWKFAELFPLADVNNLLGF